MGAGTLGEKQKGCQISHLHRYYNKYTKILKPSPKKVLIRILLINLCILSIE